MEQEKQKIRIPMMQRSLTTELSEEFSIPDYQPEIKRILRVEAQAMPADRYVGSSSAEFSGKMEYTLFYLGEDGELYGSSFEGDYRVLQLLEIPGDFSFDDGVLCDADIFSESVSGRLLSPRKFQIKTRLHSEIRLYATKTLEEEMGNCESERLDATLVSCEHLAGQGEPFHLFDEVSVPSGDSIRVISCSGKVLASEASSVDGKLNCRGDVVLKLTTVKEGSGDAPVILLRKLPFTSEIELDGLEGDCQAAFDGCVTSCDVTVEEGRILSDAQVLLSARALQKNRLTYTRDAFALGEESAVSLESCGAPVAIASGVGNFTLSTSLPLSEAGLSSEQSVVDVTLLPVVREVSTEEGRLTLSGKCRCHAVANEGDEWTSVEFEIPFRYDGGACEPLAAKDVLATAKALSCNAKKEGDALRIDGEIALSYTLSGEESFTHVASLTTGEPITHPASALRVCYPTSSDSLWSLAKRYHQPLASLASANDLPLPTVADDPETLAQTRFIIV